MRTTIFLLTLLSSSLLFAGPDDQGEENKEAVALATALVREMNLAAQIPEMKVVLIEAVDESTGDLTPEEVKQLKEHMAADVDRGFVPMMVALFARYFTVEELKAIRDERELPSLMAKLPGWNKFCEKGGEDWGRELRARGERSVGAGIALDILTAQGIDNQIPGIIQGLREKSAGIQKEHGLTDEQTERALGYMVREFKASFKAIMAEGFAEYFTISELKAIRDDKQNPELKEKMGGLGAFMKKKAYDFGFGVGQRAVKRVLDE